MSVEDLVVHYAGWIRRHANTFCSSVSDADDLASETICKALENHNKYNNSYKFTTWVSVIMRNIYITQYNRCRCVRFEGFEEYNHCTCDMGVEESLEVRFIFRTIRHLALKSINMECLIYYAKGFSYLEISEMLDISIGTVKSRIANGRKMLSEALVGE